MQAINARGGNKGDVITLIRQTFEDYSAILNAQIIVLIGLFKYGQICTFLWKITAKFNSTVNDHDHDNDGLFTSHPRSACLFEKIYLHVLQLKIMQTGWMDEILTLTI